MQSARAFLTVRAGTFFQVKKTIILKYIIKGKVIFGELVPAPIAYTYCLGLLIFS